MDVTLRVQRDSNGYWSEIEELPGCFASGGTLEELREAIGEAVGLYLHDEPVELGDQPIALGTVRLSVPDVER